MDHQPCDETPTRSSPFQARALHFLRKLALRGRGSSRKPKDTVSPAAIPTHDFQRAHSSVDLLRKPVVSPLIGFRVEDGPSPMDTDDSSQDASASGNSPRLRPRRHSDWSSLRTTPIHSTFARHGGAPPPFHWSNMFDGYPSQASGSSPSISVQISASPESKLDDEAVQHTPNNDTPRPPGNVLPHDDSLMNLFTDFVPSASSDAGTSSGALRSPNPKDFSSESVQKRPVLLPHHSTPLAPPFRLTTERGLRLSPSIISRQPMPLLNLPALPPPPPVPDMPPRQKVPLRSMPSLSRHGRSNTESPADHENATIGDSDEEDVDEGGEEEFMDASSVHQSDDEDDESPGAGPSGTQDHMNPQEQYQRSDPYSAECSISPVSALDDFIDPNSANFSSKSHTHATRFTQLPASLEMRPFSPDIPNAEDVALRHNLDPDLPIPGARLGKKPSLYRVASRSMVNLGSTRRAERPLKSREMGSNPTSTSGHASEAHEDLEESDTEAMIGRLLRRTSMPSFHPTSDPPPYPTFNPRPRESRVMALEDEGRERLPPYTNALYLIAIMPRKMEFTSPGIQAKDRKWRRVVCELEGTAFRVYKCPPGASGAGVLGDWWEKHVGVGDVAGPNLPRSRTKGPEGQLERPEKLGVDDRPPVTSPQSLVGSAAIPPVRRRTGSQTSIATQSTMPRPTKRVSAASFLSPFRSSSSTRIETGAGDTSRLEPRESEVLTVDVQDNRSSTSHEPTGRATPVTQRMSQPPPQLRSTSRFTFLPIVTGRTQWRSVEIPKPSKSALLRAYTLQHAESGLGNDYLKRKNVIRVRLEGEQFLLQAPDIPAVVEWIEGLHAGTNIALDIDQRPMPRGPMFPRRRRRRPRRTQSEDPPGHRPSGSQT